MATPRSIMQKLADLPVRVQADSTFGDNLASAAQAALIAGNRDAQGNVTQQWDTYMRIIVGSDSPKQLARLNLNDDQATDLIVKKSVAYVVANALCAPGTNGNTGAGTNTTLDHGVPAEPEPANP